MNSTKEKGKVIELLVQAHGIAMNDSQFNLSTIILAVITSIAKGHETELNDTLESFIESMAKQNQSNTNTNTNTNTTAKTKRTVFVEDGQFSEHDAILLTEPISIDGIDFFVGGQKIIVNRCYDQVCECLAGGDLKLIDGEYEYLYKNQLIEASSIVAYPVVSTD